MGPGDKPEDDSGGGRATLLRALLVRASDAHCASARELIPTLRRGGSLRGFASRGPRARAGRLREADAHRPGVATLSRRPRMPPSREVVRDTLTIVTVAVRQRMRGGPRQAGRRPVPNATQVVAGGAGLRASRKGGPPPSCAAERSGRIPILSKRSRHGRSASPCVALSGASAGRSASSWNLGSRFGCPLRIRAHIAGQWLHPVARKGGSEPRGSA